MSEPVVDATQTAFDASISPVLEIDPGDTVTFRTPDTSYRRMAAGESLEQIGIENVNVVIGPVLVRGAVPGDALLIDVLDIHVESAWSVWVPGLGPLGGKTDRMLAEQVAIDGAVLRLTDGIEVPLAPMIGCIGVAPRDGIGSTFGPAYPYGGNMDLRELSPGATLLLPVQTDGALLSVGDLHAAMGHAEPTFVAIEASGAAMVRVELEKDAGLSFPRLRVDGSTICVGVADTFEHARAIALDQAFDVLTSRLGAFDAYKYMSAYVDVRFGGPTSPIVLAVVPDLP